MRVDDNYFVRTNIDFQESFKIGRKSSRSIDEIVIPGAFTPPGGP